jgi:phosphohistidine phosphatase SixA
VNHWRTVWMGLCAVLVTVLVATSSAQNSPSLQGRALLEELRKGGYVLFFRHERTDMSQSEREANFLERAAQTPSLWEDCDAQRNLSDAGRAGARAQGEAFRSLNIPVGEVIASPFCRAWEHARLAFERYVLNRDIVNTFNLSRTDSRRVRAADTTRNLLSSLPRIGTNTVVVAHQPSFQDVTDIALSEGEAGISRSDGRGGFVIVARVKTEGWLELAR